MIILILGISITIIVALISYLDKRGDNIEKGKTNNRNIVTFFFLSSGSIISFYSGCSSEDSKKIAEHKYDSVNSLIIYKTSLIDSITRRLDSTQTVIIDSQIIQLSESKKILETAKKVNDLQNQTQILQKRNYEIAGKIFMKSKLAEEALISKDSYPILNIYMGSFGIGLYGKYPVVIHEIKIWDNVLRKKIYTNKKEIKIYKEHLTYIDKEMRNLYYEKDSIDLRIEFQTSNGWLIQTLKRKKVLDKYFSSIKLFNYLDVNKILFEKTTDGF